MNAQKTKILYLITKSNWGGAQRYLYDLATHLPTDKYEVVVACGGTGELVQKLWEKNVRTLDISTLKRDINIFGDIVVFFSLIKLLTEEQPDILHVNSSKIGGLGAFVGRLMLTPHIIFTAHGWTFNEERPWLARKLISFLHWLTVVFSHTTIVVSDALKKDMQHLPFIRHKMIVIRNGMELPHYKSRADARHYLVSKVASTTPPLDSPWIGTIAELHKSKGLVYALNAWVLVREKYPHARYFILGEGEEKSLLKQQIKEFGLEHEVFLVGFVPNAAVYLNAFDIFLLPSTTEALGFVLLEAGGAKLPAIASRVGGIPEIITDKQTGLLVESQNVEQISHALAYLLENPNEGKRMGEALKKEVAKKFNFEKMLSQTLGVYRLRS